MKTPRRRRRRAPSLGIGLALIRLAIALAWLVAAVPAQAAVTMTFWSHEFGRYFPHAFVTLHGTPDAGGAAVEASYGFTAKSLSLKILFGTVPGKVEPPAPDYVARSRARFAVVLSDAQYAAIRGLAAAWDEKTGDARYNLDHRNCVHFVKEAARIAGLGGLDRPKLMKKPDAYLRAVAAANPGRVELLP